jgi:hypothetical protein
MFVTVRKNYIIMSTFATKANRIIKVLNKELNCTFCNSASTAKAYVVCMHQLLEELADLISVELLRVPRFFSEYHLYIDLEKRNIDVSFV